MKQYISLLFLVLFLFGCGDNQTNSSESNTEVFSIQHGLSSDEIFSISQKLLLKFSSPLDTSTVNSDSVYLEYISPEGALNVGSYTGVNNDTNSVYLTPYEYLYPSSQYRLVVTTDVKDINGRSLDKNYEYSFVTDAEIVDSSSFGIRSLKPNDADTGVLVSVDIVVDFNATLSAEPEYSNQSYFSVTYEDVNGTQNIPGKIEVFNSLLRFTPDNPLPYDTNITVGLVSDVQNLYGTSTSVSGTKWNFVTNSEELQPKSNGFFSLNALVTGKKTSSLAKYGSKFIVARTEGIDMYEINYIDNIPNTQKLSSFEISSPITSMVIDDKYILVSTLSNGIYILQYQADGTITLLQNNLVGESIFSVRFGETNTSRIYAVGPTFGLEIFSFDSTANSTTPLYEINTSIVGTALDVVEVDQYDNNASSNVQKLYIADYSGGMVILDINGTYISRTELNASIKRFTFNEDYNGKLGIFAISSSGKSQSLGFDGAIFSNVKTQLPGTTSSVYSHVDSVDFTSNLYYSNFEKGIIKTSGDYIDNIIYTGGSVVASAYVDAEFDPIYDAKITRGFLVSANEDGTIQFYNATSDTEGPSYIYGEYPTANTLDANISIFLSDAYFDEAQIRDTSFKVYDLNVSTTNPINVSFSKSIGELSMIIVLDPEVNVTSGDTYLVNISASFSDKFGQKFNAGVDKNISFVVE